ncbi:hypothetical protein HK105_208176 [Polyrhizophydium stewartii]|uniref:PLAC8-domain-containing protein n=1 Tax=Polyrhizophydium stewartii TaxID=2732419 RepID=A0ABR4MYM5_9FUNG|nr:hypothetical protein HK105_004233 [Polyrhizophydium stewartii]
MSYNAQPQMGVAAAPSKKAEFTHGLFDCFGDFGTCLMACFCPCVVYGQNQQRAENKDGSCMDCCIYYCAAEFGFHSCIGCYGRGKIKERTNVVNDSSMGDCFTHLCCAPCALTQEKRELDVALGAR